MARFSLLIFWRLTLFVVCLLALVGCEHDESKQDEITKELSSLIKAVNSLKDVTLQMNTVTDCSVAKARGSWQSIIEVNIPSVGFRKVKCDQYTDGGGWTVILKRSAEHLFTSPGERNGYRKTKASRKKARNSIFKRKNRKNSGKKYPGTFHRTDEPMLNFNRTWEDYKIGFGDPKQEFWIGNEVLSRLTEERPWMLAVVLEHWNGDVASAKWTSFRVHGEDSNYRVEISGYSAKESPLPDALTYHHGKQFSTADADNDDNEGNCAEKYGGGWWFHQCHVSFLTGTHLNPHNSGHHSVHWLPWKNNSDSLKSATMMIRPYYP